MFPVCNHLQFNLDRLAIRSGRVGDPGYRGAAGCLAFAKGYGTWAEAGRPAYTVADEQWLALVELLGMGTLVVDERGSGRCRGETGVTSPGSSKAPVGGPPRLSNMDVDVAVSAGVQRDKCSARLTTNSQQASVPASDQGGSIRP
jgi:hypothetical protein